MLGVEEWIVPFVQGMRDIISTLQFVKLLCLYLVQHMHINLY